MKPISKFQIAYVVAGFLSLVVASLLDNMRGPLLPIITEALSIPISAASWFFTLGNFAAIFLTFLIMFLLQKYSERKIAITLGCLSILGICYAFSVNSYWQFLVFAAILGVSLSFFGAFCNILTIRGTPLNHQAKTLAALHTTYGVASMLCPILVVFLIQRQWPWPHIFLLAIPFIFLVISILWTKTPEEGPTPQLPIKLSSLTSTHFLILCFVALYINCEVLCSIWMTTYLQKGLGLEFKIASYGISGFFFCLALSRGLTSWFFSIKREKIILYTALIISILAFWISYVNQNPYLLVFTGFLGPFFPVLLAKISKKFPTQWQSMTLGIVIFQQVSGAILNYTMGQLSDSIGIRQAFMVPGIMMLLTLILLPKILRVLQEEQP